MAGEAVLGVAILNRELGSCLGQSGVPLNPHIAWALLQSLAVVSRHALLEDTVVVTPPYYHLVRMLAGSPNRFAYALVDGTHVLLGAARLQLERAVE